MSEKENLHALIVAKQKPPLWTAVCRKVHRRLKYVLMSEARQSLQSQYFNRYTLYLLRHPLVF